MGLISSSDLAPVVGPKRVCCFLYFFTFFVADSLADEVDDDLFDLVSSLTNMLGGALLVELLSIALPRMWEVMIIDYEGGENDTFDITHPLNMAHL